MGSAMPVLQATVCQHDLQPVLDHEINLVSAIFFVSRMEAKRVDQNTRDRKENTLSYVYKSKGLSGQVLFYETF